MCNHEAVWEAPGDKYEGHLSVRPAANVILTEDFTL